MKKYYVLTAICLIVAAFSIWILAIGINVVVSLTCLNAISSFWTVPLGVTVIAGSSLAIIGCGMAVFCLVKKIKKLKNESCPEQKK